MAVITISSELGSGGIEIGQRVATSLGYELVDKHTADTILRQYGLTKFNQLYDAAPSLLDLIRSDNLLIVSMLNEIVEAFAKRGNIVILGRAGFAILSQYVDVLHVRIRGPFPERVQRVMAREGPADLPAVEERVREDDDVHRKYVQRFYNRQWDGPAGFGLVLDTGSLSIDAAVTQVVEAARALAQQAPSKDAITTATIEVDPVLADAIAKAMAVPSPG